VYRNALGKHNHRNGTSFTAEDFLSVVSNLSVAKRR